MVKANKRGNSEYNTLSILAFIFAFLFPPVGFILGIVALSQIKKTDEKGKGLAVAAIVLGAVFFLFLMLMILIGIAWIAMKNVVIEGVENSDLSTKCLNTQVIVTNVANTAPQDFDVTISRRSGFDEIGGVKLVFTNNDDSSSYVADIAGNIQTLIDKTAFVSVSSDVVDNPSKVSAVVYFLDEAGDEKLCQTANQLKF